MELKDIGLGFFVIHGLTEDDRTRIIMARPLEIGYFPSHGTLLDSTLQCWGKKQNSYRCQGLHQVYVDRTSHTRSAFCSVERFGENGCARCQKRKPCPPGENLLWNWFGGEAAGTHLGKQSTSPGNIWENYVFFWIITLSSSSLAAICLYFQNILH